MTVKQVLKLAAIIVRNGWTQMAAARTIMMKKVDAHNPNAFYFCMLGALLRAAGKDDQSDLAVRAIEAIRRSPACPLDEKGEKHLLTWHDTPGRTSEEVATLLETVASEQPDPEETP